MIDEGWIGKRVFILLKNNRRYTGRILKIDRDSPPLIFITILDKFDKNILFLESEIELIQEEGE
jgi:hypothetical protein